MKQLFSLLIGLTVWFPGLAIAEQAGAASGGYRGIASIYYTLIWVILSYGLYDSFGKKAMYVGAPIMALIIYFVLPSA